MKQLKYNLTILISLFMVSCANNCIECEKKLKLCLLSQPLPVNLPEPDSDPNAPETWTMEVGVNAENEYLLSDTLIVDNFEEFEQLIVLEMEKRESDERRLKIAGDQNADYGAVFKLIALAQRNNYRPILVYK